MGRLIVRWLEREPGERDGTGGQPLSQQGGFAAPGRGRQEDQGPLQALLQLVEQAGTRHQVGTQARPLEFAGQQRLGWQASQQSWPPGRAATSPALVLCLAPSRRGGSRPRSRGGAGFLLGHRGWRLEPEGLGDLLQARQGQLRASAQIALGQFSRDAGVGIPVLPTPLPVLLPCRVGAVVAMEGERGELAHP